MTWGLCRLSTTNSGAHFGDEQKTPSTVDSDGFYNRKEQRSTVDSQYWLERCKLHKLFRKTFEEMISGEKTWKFALILPLEIWKCVPYALKILSMGIF